MSGDWVKIQSLKNGGMSLGLTKLQASSRKPQATSGLTVEAL